MWSVVEIYRIITYPLTLTSDNHATIMMELHLLEYNMNIVKLLQNLRLSSTSIFQ